MPVAPADDDDGDPIGNPPDDDEDEGDVERPAPDWFWLFWGGDAWGMSAGEGIAVPTDDWGETPALLIA